MKKLVSLLSALLFFTLSQAQWYSADHTFTSGTYTNVGWPSGKTLTIPSGSNVIFNGGGSTYGGGNLVVNGNLTVNSSFQIAQNVTIGPGATLTVNDNFITERDIVFPLNSVIKIQGTYSINGGSPVVTIDGPALFEMGKLSLNAAQAQFIIKSNSTVKAGNVKTSGVLTVEGILNVTEKLLSDGGKLTLQSSGKINAADVWFQNPNNNIYGVIKASNEVAFHNAPNVIDCPAQIITKNLKNQSAPNPISGSGYIEVTGSFTGQGNALTASSAIVVNIATLGSGGNIGSATPGTKSAACGGSLPSVLPVTFGQVQASVSNGSLQVNWSTLSEKNNDHFIVQVSADGREFHTIGAPVASKATDGNSDSALAYSFNQTFSASAVAAITLALLLIFPAYTNRRTKWMVTAIAIVIVAGLYSCSKNDAVAVPQDKEVFVRVGQVDKDGTTKYSPAVKAVK